MKIGIVCSHGGHLTELLYFARAYDDQAHFLVTYDNKRTSDLPGTKYLFDNFGEKPSRMIREIPRVLKILRQERPDLLISDGAEIALPFFAAARLLGIRTIFIESYTRIVHPTVTGRLVIPIADRFIVLWPELKESYGHKAQFIAPPFKPSNSRKTGEKSNTILVLTGMHFRGFDRLIKWVDETAQAGRWRFIIQTGSCQQPPIYAEHFDYLEYEQVIELIRHSDAVLCHGAMSAVDALVIGKPVMILPRGVRQGEAIDDHQTIFANRLVEMRLAVFVDEERDLSGQISECLECEPRGLEVNKEFVEQLRSLTSELGTSK